MATPPPDHVGRLPIRDWGFVNCPAIPFWANPLGDPDLERVLAFIEGLKGRAAEGMPAYCGLSTKYTIGGQTLPAYTFLYGTPLPPPCGAGEETPQAGTAPTELDLDDPKQFMPKLAIYTCDKQPFHRIPEGIPTFEKLPG